MPNIFEDKKYIKKAMDYSIERKKNKLENIKKYLAGPANIVLELGCGSGVLSSIHKKWIGTDISFNALKNCNGNAIQADSAFLPIKTDSIDFIFSVNHLEHVKNPKKAIDEALRVLKKDGIIALKDEWYCEIYPQNNWKKFLFYPLFRIRLSLRNLIDELHIFLGLKRELSFIKLNNKKGATYERASLFPNNVSAYLKSNGFICLNEKNAIKRIFELDAFNHPCIDGTLIVLKKAG